MPTCMRPSCSGANTQPMVNATKHEMEGKKDQLKGQAKKEYGKATGDKSKQVEGTLEKSKGKAQEKFGKANR